MTTAECNPEVSTQKVCAREMKIHGACWKVVRDGEKRCHRGIGEEGARAAGGNSEDRTVRALGVVEVGRMTGSEIRAEARVRCTKPVAARGYS